MKPSEIERFAQMVVANAKKLMGPGWTMIGNEMRRGLIAVDVVCLAGTWERSSAIAAVDVVAIADRAYEIAGLQP